MNDYTELSIAAVLYGYCADIYTAEVAKSLLAMEGVSVNLKTCWNGNKAEVEYKNKLYIIEI